MAGFLAACATTHQDRSASISRALVGQWEWVSHQPERDCSYLENMAFRSNGTLTRTSDGCGFSSDGFGIFSYGWYVANEYLCFTDDERQYTDEVPRNSEYKSHFMEQVNERYVKERCYWKIKRISRRKIEVEIDRDGYQEAFVMHRRRWL